MTPVRGEVWLLDLGMAEKVRPGLILNVDFGDQDRALITVVPHTTTLRGSQFEIPVPVPFLRPGAFLAQNIATYPSVRAFKRLGVLRKEHVDLVGAGIVRWLGLTSGVAGATGGAGARRMYMVIERFKGGRAVPLYRRFRDKGRMAPPGVTYISSWVDEDLTKCYQLMETNERKLLDEWVANWIDLVDFEIVPVLTSKEAADRVASSL